MSSKQKTVHGLGKRKSAVAQVLLTTTKDQLDINGISLDQYFPTTAMQITALKPLEITSQKDIYGLRIKVSGGGKHSQAQAVQVAIARALVAADASHRKQLKKAGLLTRDARVKERKKPGLKRARRAPQFSKR